MSFAKPAAIAFGLAMAIIAHFLSVHVVRWSDHSAAVREANESFDACQATLRSRLAALEDVAVQLEQMSQGIDRNTFLKLAGELRQNGASTAEWLQRVPYKDRGAVAAALSEEYGRPIRLRVQLNTGRMKPLPPQRAPMFVSTYAAPAYLEDAIIGVHRQRVQTDSFMTGRTPVVTPLRKFFRKQPSFGAYRSVVSEEGHFRGLVLITFADNPFGLTKQSSRSLRTMAQILDDRDDKEKPTVAATHEVEAFPRETILEKPLVMGQREYLFKFHQNPKYRSTLASLPWVALLLGPIATIMFGSRMIQRRSAELSRLNSDLQRQICEREEIQRTLQSLLEFREQERKLVSNEIHDGFIQTAIGAQMFLESLEARLEAGGHDTDPVARKHLDQALDLVRAAVDEGRRLVGDLRPLAVDQIGLLPALQRLTEDTNRRFGMSIALRYPTDLRELPIRVQRAIYRIVQESLSNIRRHSKVQEATITLTHRESVVNLEIIDHGCGFELSQTDASNFGLQSMQERVRMLEGDFRLQTSPGEGTTIAISFPINNHDPTNNLDYDLDSAYAQLPAKPR